MNEDIKPERLAELVLPSEAVRRDIELAQQFYRDNEPMIRQVQQAQRIIWGSEATRRQIEPIVQAARQFVRDGRQAKTSGGPALPFAQRIALAVDAGMREFLAPGERHVVGHSAISGTTAMVSVTAVAGLATASGSAAMPSVRVQAERSAGQILALVLLWLVVLAVPAAVMAADLPPEAQVMLDAYDAILAELAVKITFRIVDKRE